jgi:LPXTG-site transpeptidase (sortase) family protein
LAAAGVVLVIAGALAWLAQAPPGAGSALGDGAAPAVSGPAWSEPVVPGSAAPGEAVRARWVPGAPRRVLIPRLDVDAPVAPVKAPGGTLVPPSDPRRLGWWAAGARPGDQTGSALVTGHTVHAGGGALDNLETLRSGDRVTVRTDRGRIRYAVRSVAVYAKGTLAKRAQRLFSQDVPGRLVLITCEDWDGSRYLSNVVVTASPVQ